MPNHSSGLLRWRERRAGACTSQEFNKKEFRSTIEIANRIKNLIDPFERGYILKKVNIDNTYPKEIFNNLEKYNQWILE